jgi:subtilisin family serine protease
VAGIISAVSDNGIGIDGVSHNANILPVNVFHVNQDGSVTATTADIFRGLKYLYVDANCSSLKVINMSLGGPTRLIDQGPPIMNVEELIDALTAAGIAVVCSAGNTGDNSARFPSDYNNTIAVIATDSNDNKATFSSYGWAKDMCAPGAGIWSTIPGGYYQPWDGTSMAAPMVSGTIALMYAANPNLTVSQVRFILHDTAVDLGDPGQDEIFGWGRLNTLDAVLRARDGYWDRMYGSDRYFTMQNISCEGWEDNSCDAVVLALGSAFPDALAGTGLAGTLDAPIILTGGSTLSPQAATEISRLGASTVYICGGTGAISDTVKASVEALPGVQQVIRLGGTDRFATCYSIYQAGIGDWSDTLIVGTGMSSADVLSISPYAFANESPVFLVNGQGNMTTNMKSAISGGAFSKAVIVGSTSIVSTETENYLKTYLGNNNVIRLFGSDRYKTSSQIANWESGELSTAAFQPSTVLDYAHCTVVNGVDTSFADALSGGAFAGHKGSVMLLAQDLASDSNYTVTNNIVPHIYDVEKGYIIGGPSILSEAFEMYLEGLRMAS